MGKSSKVESVSRDKEICQNCKWHSNNPSYCKGLSSYVGRKESCVDWKRKQYGLGINALS